MLEPIGRNTAPAITMAALFAKATYGSDTALFVAPSDHIINDTDAFLSAIDVGIEATQSNQLVTFGVLPYFAEIGFGYINAEQNGHSATRVKAFVEKPDLNTAIKIPGVG